MKNLKLVIENYEFEVPVFEKEGTSWVALKPICDVLGVSRQKQQEKVLRSKFIRWNHMVLPSAGGSQETLCVDIDHIGEWIFGINPNKVKPEIKERMILFRRKLQHVLYAAVTGHIDVNMVQTLVEEIKQLREENREMREENAEIKDLLTQQGNQLETQDRMINHLLMQNQLNEQYVVKQLASVGGKLLSNASQKKRRLTLVG